MKQAVVLLSGGLDSYTAAAMARSEGFALNALTVQYGQVHALEVAAARAVAKSLEVKAHIELAVDLRALARSALTGSGEVPKQGIVDTTSIPATYVPARNTIFLALACAWGETLGAFDVFIGVNAIDYSGYPDCRPEYLRQFEQTMRLGTKAGQEGESFRIQAPLSALSKAQIIRRGVELGLDYGLTHSCYDPAPDGAPCGACDSCVLRARGFEEAGVPDPLFRS